MMQFRKSGFVSMPAALAIVIFGLATNGPVTAAQNAATTTEKDAKALDSLNQAIALNPQDARALLKRGDLYAGRQQYNLALADYDKAVALTPDATSLDKQGQARAKLGHYDDAIGSLMKALELSPKSARILNDLGWTYLRSRSYDMAQSRFEDAMAAAPTEAEAYTNRAILFNEKRDWKKAIADLDKSIELEPSGARAYLYRAIAKTNADGIGSKVYSNEVKRTAIEADVSKGIQLDPALKQEFIKVARSYYTNGKTRREEAMALLSGVVAGDPRDAGSYLELAEAQVAAYNSDGAILNYGKALEIDSKNTTARRSRAQAYFNSARPYNDPKFALAIADLKLANSPNAQEEAARLALLGKCQYNAGQLQDGLETFRALAKLNDADTYAHFSIGLGLALTGEKEAAIQEVKAALAKATENQIKQGRSEAQSASGKYPDSEALKAIIALYPAEAEDNSNLDILFL